MTITYQGINLDYYNVTGLARKTPIQNEKTSYSISVSIPNYFEYRELFKSDYSDITIVHDSITYYYTIQEAPTVTENSININAVPKIYKAMQEKLTTLFGYYEENPITIVKAILTAYSISYDNYSFGIAEAYFEDSNIIIEAVFAPSFMDSSIYDYIDAVLMRINCSMYFDIAENKVYLHNYLYDSIDTMAELETDYIGNDLTENESDIYYTGYEITVVEYDAVTGYTTKKLAQSREIEYAYEWTDGTSTIYVYQGFLQYTTLGLGNPATLLKAQFDFDNNIYIASGTIGAFTGNSSVYSAGLDVDLTNKARLSKLKYGKENVWKDNNGSNDSGCIRFNDLTGAYEIGNSIIKRAWKKAKILSFLYYQETPYEVGDYILYNSKIYLIAEKKLLQNLTTYAIVLTEWIE